MENASKALIIAGAILLSILIIGLGMFIYTKAAGAMDTSQIDQQKVQAYNAPYDQYFGTNVSGANVRALIDSVNTHNVATTSDTSLRITITPSGITGAVAGYTSASLTTMKSKIQSGKTYTVLAGNTAAGANAYDTKTGYLINIFIKQN